LASTTQQKKQWKTTRGRNNRHLGEVKYGVHVPNSVREALMLDKENGNTYWADSIALEMNALKKMGCLHFKVPPSKWNPRTEGFQYAPPQIVLNVKSSLKRKARVVAGGHVIRCDLNTYALTVKTLSIHLLYIIAAANKLPILCGDVGNAFVNAFTNEKTWT
jgi:hypothetical protein